MDGVTETAKAQSQKCEKKPFRKRGEGSIFPKKGSRFLYIQYYALNGKPIQESNKSESPRVALKLLQKRQGEVANGIVTADVRKTRYENIRALLISDYEAKKNKSLLTNRIELRPSVALTIWMATSQAGRPYASRPMFCAITTRKSRLEVLMLQP